MQIITRIAVDRSLVTMVMVTVLTVGCAGAAPPIRTNVPPSILDHPSVLAVEDHNPESTESRFLEAVNSRETFGYCLPIGSPRVERRPVLCLITELGNVYAIVDHSDEDQPTSQFEIASAVRKSETRYFLPALDVEMRFERE